MLRYRFSAVLVGCLTAFAYVLWAQDQSRTTKTVSIKVCESSPEGAHVKTLTEPTLVVTTGRPFSFVSGGSLKSKTSEDQFEIGTHLSGKVDRTGNDTMQLAMKIRIGVHVPQDDPQTEMVRTETLDIRTVLRSGEKKRLNYSASQWCEVRVDDIK